MSEPSMMILGGRRGRRPRAMAASTVRIHIRMTSQERDELSRVAAQERKSVSEVVREAVNEFVSDFSDDKPFSSVLK